MQARTCIRGLQPYKLRASVKNLDLSVHTQPHYIENPNSLLNYPEKKRVLDLFCGSGSVSKRLKELGYDVISLDINHRCHPTILCNILRWKYRQQFPPGYFEVVVASPPCEQYSQARTTKPREFEYSDRVVKKVLEIVRYFQPTNWWLENPRFGELRHRSFMRNIPYCDVDYCQFSDWGYKKPTRIWGSSQIGKLSSQICDPRVCPNVVEGSNGRFVHKSWLGGNNIRWSPKQKARFPGRLVDYLLQLGEFTPKRVENPRERNIDEKKRYSAECKDSTGNLLSTLEIRPYWLWGKHFYGTNSIRYRGEELQLVMLISAFLPDGSEQEVKVLIDTGAQANLIRKGLISEGCLKEASQRLNLRTANGQKLEGGERNVEVVLGFRQVVNGEMLPQLSWHNAVFFEADIRVDAILSFPWLVSHGIGVFPHLKALSLLEPEFTLLLGISKSSKGRTLRQKRWQPNWSGDYRYREGRNRRKRWVQTRQVMVEPWDNQEEAITRAIRAMCEQ